MKVAAVNLKRTELDHLITLVRDNLEEGSYYGNREQYQRRSCRVLARLEKAHDATTEDL